MKSRLSLIPLLLALLLTLTACNSLKRTYSLDDTLSRLSSSDRAAVALPPIDNDTPAEQLISAPIDIHAFIQAFGTDRPSEYSIYDVAAAFGIECLRENDVGSLYSVHTVEQGGQLLVFYLNEEYNFEINCWFYRQKPLSSADFSDIQVGSSLRDVVKVDPAAQVFENICRSDPEKSQETYNGLNSWHYLDDGVLEIGYAYRNGDFIVEGSLLIEEYTLYMYQADKGYLYDGHLLPIDRLPA